MESLSIRSQRSRAYLGVALAMVSVIPMLSLGLMFASLFTDLLPDSNLMRAGVAAAGTLGGVAGYLMLQVYPANMERLRDYLARMAADDLPEHVQMCAGEQDARAIEVYMNKLIGSMQTKINRLDQELERERQMRDTIRKQSEEIMEAERQRVLIESLGAACHHIGQPMTVLSLYLTRMLDTREGADDKDLKVCTDAVEAITLILRNLRQVSTYRTVPYISFQGDDALAPDVNIRILDIEPPAPVASG